MRSKKEIVFYFPDYGIGGVQSLFISSVLFFSEHGYRVYLVDYADGTISKKLLELNANFIHLNIQRICPNLNPQIVIITPILDSKFYRYFESQNPLFIFWNLFPNALQRISFIKGVKIPYISNYYHRKICTELINRKAFIAMSLNGLKQLDNNKCLNIDNKSQLIVPVSFDCKSKAKYKRCRFNNGKINLVTIARFVKWKFNSIIQLINDINKIKSTNLSYTIITDEPDKALQYLNRNTVLKCINLKILGQLQGEDLSNYIDVKNLNLGYSMGISTLETASMGIPTIVSDVFYFKYQKKFKYQFLSERINFDLGDIINKNEITKGRVLNEILKYLSAKINYNVQSKLDCNYANKHYNISRTSLSLYAAATKTNCRINTIKELIMSMKLKK
jgi:hypothetical protein